jgi:transcriptional regulator of acetoin/glycerol metabolism
MEEEMTHPAHVLGERDVAIAKAREDFFLSGKVPDSGVPQAIYRSWTRCRETGLNHSLAESLAPANRTLLAESRDRSEQLLHQASGIMEHVFAQIRHSGSMVILSDSEGMIIHSLGDPAFVDRASRVALQPGASWNEALRGTNAIGTALADRMPVEVYGPEHYCDCNGFLTCSAVPVFDVDGRVAGVLDISGDYRNHQRHTLGLVKLSVQLLEKRLFEQRFENHMLLAFHARPEYLGSLQEAIVAIDEQGDLLGANQVAREWLASLGREAKRLTFGSLFKGAFGAFADKTGSVSGSAMGIRKLELRDGGQIYAQLRGLRRVSVAKIDAGSSNRPRSQALSAAPVSSCAQSGRGVTLECLDTGDERLHLALDRARRVAGRGIPLLIQGESGVGKELFAQAFHNSGPRAGGAFVALNCAAIPETLIESELFGYVGGAFTGARREGSIGKIQQADGGTLFLDEIGDMPLGMQARLLRVLQERSVTPVGGLKQVPVDISLVCATHCNLREAVARGVFREDLYYRVNGLSVTLPPLRERTDIRGLVANVLAVECAEASLTDIAISEQVLGFFSHYAWPGNIRQLQNVIRLALALLDPDESEIRAVHLPEELFGEEAMANDYEHTTRREQVATETPGLSKSGADEIGMLSGRGQRLEEIELSAIRAVLRDTDGNLSAAARKLGVSRNTLYRKLGKM